MIVQQQHLLVNGTTSTNVSSFVEYKMVLDTSIQQEQGPQIYIFLILGQRLLMKDKFFQLH